MSTLQEIRDRVRNQLDLDDTDLTDTVLDGFIREGFDRTFALEQQWPFFEYSWSLTQTAGSDTITMPSSPTVASISSLRNTDTNKRLVYIAQRVAEENFDGVLTEGEPSLFSVWGSTLYLWPPPTDVERPYALRGYRDPTWTGVADDEIDGDERLHAPITHYACSLAYAQQEDPELEDTYMRRWASSASAIRDEIMRPRTHEPLILNGGLSGRRRSTSIWLEV